MQCVDSGSPPAVRSCGFLMFNHLSGACDWPENVLRVRAECRENTFTEKESSRDKFDIQIIMMHYVNIIFVCSHFEDRFVNLSNLRIPDFYHLPDERTSEALNDLGDYATMNMLHCIINVVNHCVVHFRLRLWPD